MRPSTSNGGARAHRRVALPYRRHSIHVVAAASAVRITAFNRKDARRRAVERNAGRVHHHADERGVLEVAVEERRMGAVDAALGVEAPDVGTAHVMARKAHRRVDAERDDHERDEREAGARRSLHPCIEHT